MAHLPILNADADAYPERFLVVGDPGRIDRVTPLLSDVEDIAWNREYRSIRGSFDGVDVAVVSHGVGSAGAGACFEEICMAGAARIVRAGSAGGMQSHVGAGDVVIATAAVREDGLSHKLVPATWPATASTDVVVAMRHAADALSTDVHEGIVLTSDMFYPHEILGSDLPLWQRAGVIAVEMEIATLFTVAGLSGVECGAVVAIDGNPLEQDEGSMETYNPRQDSVQRAVEQSLQIALRALISNRVS